MASLTLYWLLSVTNTCFANKFPSTSIPGRMLKQFLFFVLIAKTPLLWRGSKCLLTNQKLVYIPMSEILKMPWTIYMFWFKGSNNILLKYLLLCQPNNEHIACFLLIAVNEIHTVKATFLFPVRLYNSFLQQFKWSISDNGSVCTVRSWRRCYYA